MFLKDEYIVTLILKEKQTCCAKENYIFKQREDRTGIYPCVDLEGSCSNSNDSYSFGRLRNLLDWRYADLDEIEEYERIGKPYDVTTLNSFILPEKWCIRDCKEVSEYAHKLNNSVLEVRPQLYYHYGKELGVNGCGFKENIFPNYTEITLQQFIKYVLNQNTYKEDYYYLIELLANINIK